MKAIEVLRVPMQPNDANAETVGDYLVKLLDVVWREEQGFSGKRPFGNSGWQHEVYTALARAGAIEGELEYKGDPSDPWDFDEWDYDTGEADKLIQRAIKELGTLYK